MKSVFCVFVTIIDENSNLVTPCFKTIYQRKRFMCKPRSAKCPFDLYNELEETVNAR